MEGKKADIVIFNPATIADNQSYTKPWAAPEGVCYVIKNGEIAVEKKQYHHKKLGKIIALANL